jgi:hypothetical protein
MPDQRSSRRLLDDERLSSERPSYDEPSATTSPKARRTP